MALLSGKGKDKMRNLLKVRSLILVVAGILFLVACIGWYPRLGLAAMFIGVCAIFFEGGEPLHGASLQFVVDAIRRSKWYRQWRNPPRPIASDVGMRHEEPAFKREPVYNREVITARGPVVSTREVHHH